MGPFKESDIRVDRVAYHRNGSGGEGFHVVLFRLRDGRKFASMAGVLFEESGRCAVFAVQDLVAGTIGFGEGSWDGPAFEPHLRAHVARWEEGRASA